LVATTEIPLIVSEIVGVDSPPSLEVMYGTVTVLELKGLVTTVIRMVVEL